ncbi:hypothetical protein GCM10011500_28420 [Mucilaginibacter rubeus]|nr:hypothetical protein GCM10011500_28420 [Mucilaginibacter rubeus]
MLLLLKYSITKNIKAHTPILKIKLLSGINIPIAITASEAIEGFIITENVSFNDL